MFEFSKKKKTKLKAFDKDFPKHKPKLNSINKKRKLNLIRLVGNSSCFLPEQNCFQINIDYGIADTLKNKLNDT